MPATSETTSPSICGGRLAIASDGKRSDGPLIRHPLQIADNSRQIELKSVDVNMHDHKLAEKDRQAQLIASKAVPAKILDVLIMPMAINMRQFLRKYDDKEIEGLVEAWYVHTRLYLQPGKYMPPHMVVSFKKEWDMNAMGIYYRHNYSDHWGDSFFNLWIPTVNDLEWDHPSEAVRRQRANVFLKHALDNEKWNKSEFAWEADAWSDVFGYLRDDPLVVANKHTYYTTKGEHYPVSCLLNGNTKKIYRTPDATFGLATFKPEDYQNALACYELDHDRLHALMLHPDCGIISDPQLGNTNMVFPFAVYEAKGWSGDARDARHQACSAAAVYLDILHDLGTAPDSKRLSQGLKEQISEFREPLYQAQGPKAQVFALTSFGAHWHILVGYRRRRTEEESADMPGLSEHVYIYQRVWSARVVTERKAWELLSLIDQIHEWGVTEHRERVIHLLKRWHAYCSKRFAASAEVLRALPDMYRAHDGRTAWNFPIYVLPKWAEHLGPGKRASLELRMKVYVLDSYITRFRPHPPGHLEALLDLRERFKRDGEGLECWDPHLDGSEPPLKKHKDRTVRRKDFIQPAMFEPTQRSLVLRPKGRHSPPGSPHLPIKRPLSGEDDHASGGGKRHKP